MNLASISLIVSTIDGIIAILELFYKEIALAIETYIGE